MTRSLYDYLVRQIERMPFMSKPELNSACANLSGALRELVK